MFVICANTIEEAERDLRAMKQAVATGKPIGCGGDTVEEVEQAMKCLREAISAHGECCHLDCDCGCCPGAEDCYDDGCCEDCDYTEECEDCALPAEDEEDFCGCCENCDSECVNRNYTLPDNVSVDDILNLLEKIVNHLNS